MTGTYMVHVPYKGSAPATADLLAGRVHLMFDNLASALPNIQARKVRARYEDEGAYRCRVTDQCETRFSNSASVSLPTPVWVQRCLWTT